MSSEVSQFLANQSLSSNLSQSIQTDFSSINATQVIPALTKEFGNKWSWEVVDQSFTQNEEVILNVRVYIPGQILYGRYVTKDYEIAHLYAIHSACEMLSKDVINSTIQTFAKQEEQRFIENNIAKEEPVSTPVQHSAPVMASQPKETDVVSEDDIMSIINENNAKIQNQAQAPKQIDSLEALNTDPREEIPFNDITDNCYNEMANSMQPQAPKEKKKFTPEQIAAMNQIKKDFDIVNDEMFGNYVNSWNPKLSKKSDLTPDNADSFIAWAKSLGECPC